MHTGWQLQTCTSYSKYVKLRTHLLLNTLIIKYKIVDGVKCVVKCVHARCYLHLQQNAWTEASNYWAVAFSFVYSK